MKMKNYRVTFDTKKGGMKHWAIDVIAENELDARLTATDMWFWEKVMTTNGTYSQYNMKATSLDGEIKYSQFTMI